VPSWWDFFTSSNSGIEWEKGHLVGSQFGGTVAENNVVPEYEQVNQSPIKRLDYRIANLIDLNAGPVVETIVINYSNTGTLKLAPSSLDITVQASTGPALKGTIRNVAAPNIPPDFANPIRKWPP
jgi:hypothetical protein